MSASECPVCGALPGEPHKMSCRPQNREDAERARTMKTLPQNILLVYEEIPDRTVILYLNADDLAKADLTFAQLTSIHGTYVNSSDMTDDQQEIHDKVSQAIFGEWDEEKESAKPALWQSAKIFQGDDEDLNKEGNPPKIDLGAIVIHCGFAL